MKYEVDQSGRIEETNRHTIIAIANKDFAYTLKIDSKIKRSIQKKFQSVKKPKMFGVYGFTSGVILLINKSNIKNSIVTIDIEYDGYSKIILRELVKRTKQSMEYRFSNIGKRSPAHHAAYSVYKKRNISNFNVGLEEFEKIVLSMIRN